MLKINEQPRKQKLREKKKYNVRMNEQRKPTSALNEQSLFNNRKTFPFVLWNTVHSK